MTSAAAIMVATMEIAMTASMSAIAATIGNEKEDATARRQNVIAEEMKNAAEMKSDVVMKRDVVNVRSDVLPDTLKVKESVARKNEDVAAKICV
jgi:type II secretory pathway component PulK